MMRKDGKTLITYMKKMHPTYNGMKIRIKILLVLKGTFKVQSNMGESKYLVSVLGHNEIYNEIMNRKYFYDKCKNNIKRQNIKDWLSEMGEIK